MKQFFKDFHINSSFTAAPLLIFVLTALISMLGFIMNITLIPYALPMAVIAVLVWGMRDRSMLLSCIVTMTLMLIALPVAGTVFDLSYDGMYFHKEAVNALSDGWNPLRESFRSFSPYGNLQDLSLWMDNYPKGMWSSYACLYAMSGKIEMAKGLNIIFVLMLFFAAYDTVSSVFSKKGIPCLALSLVFTANPVIFSQYFTFMNDLPVAALIMVCAFYGMKIYADKADSMDYVCLFLAFAASFAVKFTAPVYCGFTLAGYGIAVAIKNKGKKLVKPCTVVILAAVLGFVLIGADPYIKHILNGQNPIYPVMGQGSYDIMNTNAPKGLDQLPTAVSFFISLFSKVAPNPGDIPVWKIPFTMDWQYEISGLNAPDVRLSGFGIWFSGLLILTVILGILSIRKSKGASSVIPALCVFTLLVLFFPESWWARYHPYFYYVPCMLLLAFSCAPKRNTLVLAVSALFFVNCAISGAAVYRSFTSQTYSIKAKMDEIKAVNEPVYLKINDFPCHELWFKEHGIDTTYLPNDQINGETELFFRTTHYLFESQQNQVQ